MKAIIMAGGEGTRLRPITCEIPKPLVKLCGRPVSEYILDLLGEHGCTDAVFTVRYKGKMLEEHFGYGYKGINLDFIYENEPLGTAGCVRNAAGKARLSDDDFVVISGDAMCDFDLSEALDFHRKSGACATICTKKVDDPREYGLVIAENGNVQGFIEKPSYLSCICDCANTGVYILSPEILPLIEQDKASDFAKDIFPLMLEKNIKISAFQCEGYWCDIGDFSTYKSCQNDMLNGKVRCSLPKNSAEIPSDVYIEAPCYIGNNVTFGKDCKITAGSVICDNVCVSAKAEIRNSVLLNGCVIGERVNCVNAIICEDARLEHGSSVYGDAVVGAQTIVGENSTIESGVKIWSNKNIPAEASIKQDVKYEIRERFVLDEMGFSGATNMDMTPEFVAKLGSAASSVFGKKSVVACSRNNASVALKAAFCAGLSASGADALDCGALSLPMLIFTASVLGADGIIFISASEKCAVTLLNRGGLPLTRVQERRLESAVNRGEYLNAEWNRFGKIRSFRGASLLYGEMLSESSRFSSRYNLVLKCNNEFIKRTADSVFEKISNKNGEALEIRINSNGTKAEFRKNGVTFSYDTLLLIIASSTMKKGADFAVPAHFPSSAEWIAKSLGRNVYRFFRCSNDNSDRKARELATRELFLNDGVLLALNVLEALTNELITLEDMTGALPKLCSENRFISITCPPQKILGRLVGRNSGEGIYLGNDDDRVLLRSNKRGNGLFLYSESCSAETARDLCTDVEKLIKKLLSDEKARNSTD